MRVRNRGKNLEDVELQMTPMIDIVFQLLIFFIMTFKIVSKEGDFTIRMPIASSDVAEPLPDAPESVKVSLIAGKNGQLISASWNDVNFEKIDEEGDAAVFQRLKKEGLTEADQAIRDRYEKKGKAFETKLRNKVIEYYNGLSELQKEKAEIEFDVDYNLKYVWTMHAVAAANAKPAEGDNPVKKLIGNIKFSRPRKKP